MSLSAGQIERLVEPFLEGESVPEALYRQLAVYLDLLVKWNTKTNLTSIRDPEGMVRRHFGESLFAGVHLRRKLDPRASLLDFGSGAGFPGLPIQLLLPELNVTLSESQGKKASFLREAVRTLRLKTEVWAERVEKMPPERTFDAVTLRAVDDMERALVDSSFRLAPGGVRAILGGAGVLLAGKVEKTLLPDSRETFLYLELDVPRGT